METIRVVKSNAFGGFVPEIDGHQFHVIGKTRKDVEVALEQNERLRRAIFRKADAQEDQRNSGLLFFMCGFNGQAQTETREQLEDLFNVRVF